MDTCFMVIYYSGADFHAFWGRYVKHLNDNPPMSGYKPIDQLNPFENDPFDNLRGIKIRYDLGGVEKLVYHLAINLK